MQRRLFIAFFALALMASEPAVACQRLSPMDLRDVHSADTVVIGQIVDYRIVHDDTLRQQLLSKPDLPSSVRQNYERSQLLVFDYARFDIEVDEVLHGSAADRIAVTSPSSMFGKTGSPPSGLFLLALRNPTATTPPEDHDIGDGPNPDPTSYSVYSALCSDSFVFESQSPDAITVRRILSSKW